jgi:hypothetical protein
MRIAIITIAILSLSGCGWINRTLGYISGYSMVCVSETHVQYIQFPTGAAVLVDKNGKPVTCR